MSSSSCCSPVVPPRLSSGAEAPRYDVFETAAQSPRWGKTRWYGAATETLTGARNKEWYDEYCPLRIAQVAVRQSIGNGRLAGFDGVVVDERIAGRGCDGKVSRWLFQK